MKLILSFSLFLLAVPLLGYTPSAPEVLKRARATIATEERLKNLTTLQITGRLVPADSEKPEAIVHVVARKPLSQRLEVRVGEVVETTIINGDRSCMIRSNLSDDQSHRMRTLSDREQQRIAMSTRSLFAFFRPHYKGGETLTYAGIEQRRGVRSHKLIYRYPEGPETVRFFAVNDDTLVSVVTDQGVESVEVGAQIVDGIKFPEKIEYYEGGRHLHAFVIQAIKVNKPLTKGIFEIPAASEKRPPAGVSAE